MPEVDEDDLLEMCEESFDIKGMNVTNKSITNFVLFANVPEDEVEEVAKFWKEIDNGV